jgi:hypothetical protein
LEHFSSELNTCRSRFTKAFTLSIFRSFLRHLYKILRNWVDFEECLKSFAKSFA